ncbi:MAG: hypothetical protein ACI920_001060 [Saprospiraceae bacterium]|jgi:hypothetical protein
MKNKLSIHHHYCGPSESGNGGYSAGIFAKQLDFPAEITLRIPPPLDEELTIIREDEKALLMYGEKLVAEAKAKAKDFDLEIPPAPTFAEATGAAKDYAGFKDAPFHNCFVCGADRKAGEGLNIYAGKAGEQMVAAPWIPTENLATDGKKVDSEYIWAALDCPGAWAVMQPSEVIVLGRFAVKVVADILVGEKYIVTGWGIERDGRKIYTGTAIYTEKGAVCAYGKGTWIALK